MKPKELALNLYYDMNYDPSRSYPAAIRSAFFAERICCWGASIGAMPPGFDTELFLNLVDEGAILPAGNEFWWDERQVRPLPVMTWQKEDGALRHAAEANGGLVKRDDYWPQTLEAANGMAALFESTTTREDLLRLGGQLPHLEIVDARRVGNWDLAFELTCRVFISDWLVMPRLHATSPLSIGQNLEKYYELTRSFLRPPMAPPLVPEVTFSPSDYLAVIDSFFADITARNYVDIVAYRKDGAHRLAQRWLSCELQLAQLSAKPKKQFLANIYESDKLELGKRIAFAQGASGLAVLAVAALPSFLLRKVEAEVSGPEAKLVDGSVTRRIVRNAVPRTIEIVRRLQRQHRDWIYFLQTNSRRPGQSHSGTAEPV